MGRPRRALAIPVDELRRRYEQGESIVSLAAACGFSGQQAITCRLRDAGVVIRNPGGKPGRAGKSIPGARLTRECKNPTCTRMFEAYRSSNKKYCQPKCRYTCPERAALVARNISGRHALSEVDAEARRAVCAICGPVDIRKRVDGQPRVYSEAAHWRCRGAERARGWALNMGVTVAQVDEWMREQGGRCAICRGDNGGRHLYVDHCHISGRGRGLLCNSCNTGLGMFGDDAENLLAAARYLADQRV